MTAFMIARITVKNPEKLQEYISKVGDTMAPHGAQPLARGQATKALSGEVDHQLAAVFQFPSLEAIDAWYTSDAYQALIPIRKEGADMTIVTYGPLG